MSEFEEIRRLAVTLGVSCPESDYQVFNPSFINTLNRAAKRISKENCMMHFMIDNGLGWEDMQKDSVDSNKQT